MMQDPKGKAVGDLFPFLFDDEEIESEITEEEQQELQDLIASENERMESERKSSEP